MSDTTEAALNDLIEVSMNDRMIINHAGIIQDAVEVIRSTLASARTENERLRVALVSTIRMGNTDVLVEGSWIPVKEWPTILGNFMRDNDALGREAKGYAVEIDRLTKERDEWQERAESEQAQALFAIIAAYGGNTDV